VRNSLPVSTVAELIAFAKTNRGKLNFATTGIGTTPHLTGEMLKRWPQSTSPPYRNSAPALNDRLVGAVDATIDNTSRSFHRPAPAALKLLVSPRSRAGRWHRILPRSPTPVPALAFSGVAVRSGTPAEICDSIEARRQSRLQGPGVDRANDPTLGRGRWFGSQGVR
jgi:tripartite-type tricarboxylate transporter receptor subunit TctC